MDKSPGKSSSNKIINPFSPKSDQRQISPRDITAF